MSVDCSVYLYFPAARATDALRAVAKLLVPPPGQEPGYVRVAAKKREVVSMPTLGDDDDETYLLKEDPFDFETLLNPGPEGGAVDADTIFPADVFLELEKRYLEVQLAAFGDVAHLLVDDPFSGRLAAALAEAGGVAAVSMAFGEWRWLREPHDEIPIPEELDREEVGVDAFAAFLLKQPRAGV